ncbi:hypothetical protein DVH24_018614 [Malus domestica]|uniref:HAT C-terminal dimerisation domain-containing protein n=1 Tax=Malus domestica TaxID=3750 RepID=A0A498HK19_MALDO|nr:hypothetical protein DVH24_018614 [Malus domestica]
MILCLPNRCIRISECLQPFKAFSWVFEVREQRCLRKTPMGDEVNSYLLDPLEKVDKKTKGAFKILSWWKTSGCKYYKLIAIAKDIFAIQALVETNCSLKVQNGIGPAIGTVLNFCYKFGFGTTLVPNRAQA